jgi:hypothetical protein
MQKVAVFIEEFSDWCPVLPTAKCVLFCFTHDIQKCLGPARAGGSVAAGVPPAVEPWRPARRKNHGTLGDAGHDRATVQPPGVSPVLVTGGGRACW